MKNVEDIYRLSPMQAGMLFHCLAAPGDSVYLEQFLAQLDGELDVPAFQNAWTHVVARHPALRTAFVWEGLKEPLQAVRRQVTLPWDVLDWSDRPPVEHSTALEQLLREDRGRPFVLTQAPLMRLTLVRLAPDRHALLWSFHHLLMDGWSCALVQREVAEYYMMQRAGVTAQPEPPRPFAEYVRWLGQQDRARAEDFWRSRLRGAEPTPVRFEPPAHPEQEPDDIAQIELALSDEATARLVQGARAQGLALNTVCQAAWALVLGRYAGTDAVLFGATVSGRPPELPGVDRMIGLFINTLAVRVDLPAREPAGRWLERLQVEAAEAREHECTPLGDAQRWSGAAPGSPLFQSLLVYESYPRSGPSVEHLTPVPLRVRPLRTIEKTNYPLTLIIQPGAALKFILVVQRRLFAVDAMSRVLAQCAAALEALLHDPTRPVGEVSFLTEAERTQVVAGWNAPAEESAALVAATPASLLGQLERQAAATPDAVAVVCEGRALTYAALHGRANQLAHVLRAEGVGPEVPVAVCVGRSVELIVALLGVWKAGGAYVPLDPQAPAARLAFMVRDVGAPVVVTTTALAEQVPDAGLTRICLDGYTARLDAAPATAPACRVTSATLAYVIYTSGSTGQPKGVGITHGNVASLFAGTDALFHFTAADTWTMFHSAGFDFSVWEMWGALVYGGRLVVVPSGARTPEAFAALVRDEGVTVLNQTPSAFRAFQTVEVTGLALRVVIFGGEALVFDSLRPWHARHGLGMPQLVNMYGITETTVHVTHYALGEADMAPGTGSRVGRALPSLQLYLLDAAGQPVPIGVPGEIYVGGAGVARGYLGRPDLTATRFVPDPFGDAPGGRLYRAGDLARWRSVGGDCVAEFLGRADQQVKLRGYRIEPGEIEAALRDQPGIRDAVVQLREDVPGERRLVAYVVPDPDALVIPEHLQRALRSMLPDYMVPAAIVSLDVLPLTSNGKLDRRALPEPGMTRRTSETYLAPRDGLELQLVRVWEDLLRVRPIGVRDGFFELGGHSLLVLHLVAHIERTFDVRISLADLVQGTTIERLALMIRQKRSGTESRFVLMQPHGAGRPFFGVVPAGGTLACYVSLSELMGADRPFYALQPRNTMQEAATARTIEAMAREDLAELRRIQPSGPYALAGWSMGGFVAYEMACLLRDAGEEVELLALLDIGVPDPDQPQRDATEAALELGAQHLDLDLTELGDVTGEERMEAFLQLAQRRGRLADEVDLRWVRVLADGFRISVEAMQQYRPRPYPGRVTLIRAEEHQDNNRGLTQGWDALAQGGVDVHWVPGTHQSLVRRPQVAIVAERLRAILDGTSEQSFAISDL